MRRCKMSFITTNPNPYLVNVPELQSVLQSATGTTGDVVTFTEYIDTTTNAAQFNSIGSYNSGAITVTSDLYLSNANIYVNDSPVIVGNNGINGNLYTAFTVNNIEIARLNSNGFGIFTQTPAAPLHVNGSAIIQSDTGALRFNNAASVAKASVHFNESAQQLTVANSAGGITIATNTDLVLDGAAIQAAAAGAATGSFLRIQLNGTYYKLALFADV